MIDLIKNIDDKQQIEISFRDSYQILLAGLKKLGDSFKVQTQKTIFPYNFVNSNNLNYKGNVPEFSYFDNITHEDYEDYLDDYFPGWISIAKAKTDKMLDDLYNEALIQNPNEAILIKEYPDKLESRLLTEWNLKEEAINYCITDCISLYEILMKFNEMFYQKFKININEHPTLPGLAFRVFRSKYLKDSSGAIAKGYYDIWR